MESPHRPSNPHSNDARSGDHNGSRVTSGVSEVIIHRPLRGDRCPAPTATRAAVGRAAGCRGNGKMITRRGGRFPAWGCTEPSGIAKPRRWRRDGAGRRSPPSIATRFRKPATIDAANLGATVWAVIVRRRHSRRRPSRVARRGAMRMVAGRAVRRSIIAVARTVVWLPGIGRRTGPDTAAAAPSGVRRPVRKCRSCGRDRHPFSVIMILVLLVAIETPPISAVPTLAASALRRRAMGPPFIRPWCGALFAAVRIVVAN